MRSLVLIPQLHTLGYTILDAGKTAPVSSGKLSPFSPDKIQASNFGSQSRSPLKTKKERPIDAVAIRCPFGGPEFDSPVLLSAKVLDELEKLASSAPLHIPALIKLARRCENVFQDIPIAIVFETSFFTVLPPYERCYGLDPNAATGSTSRRYGYHGLFHEAACRNSIHRLNEERKGKEDSSPRRIISICMEPQPEIAAVMGSKPIMATSGTTPLEGLPGHTTCGELDPGIVLTLADKLQWGPEQINNVLTRESGLLGLTERPMTMGSLWNSESSESCLAREVMDYRILRACGASVAALGGVDAIVFSGRFADSGNVLGPWLASKLQSLPGLSDKLLTWTCFRESLDSIIAEAATTVAL